MTVDINAPFLSVADLPATAAANGLVVGQRPNPALGNIYDFQSVGIYRQNQILTSLNTQIGKLTLFTRYAFGHANSDTDGVGTQPANPYNIAGEYGRAVTDVHHFLFLGGSYAMRWNMRLSPFIIMRSGAPFDITTGTDLYETNAFTERPGLASGPGPGIISTPYGYLDWIPQVGQKILAAECRRWSRIHRDQSALKQDLGLRDNEVSRQCRWGSCGGRWWARWIWWPAWYGCTDGTSFQRDALR